MTIDGTGFNVGFWSRFTLDQFIEEGVKNKVYEGSVHQIEKLKVAYELICVPGSVTNLRLNGGDAGSDSTD